MTLNSYDDLRIVNIALNLIGIDPISGFDQSNDVAASCARIYPLVRDSILSRHTWTFGNSERQLGRSAEVTPLNDWAYAYRLPSNQLAGPEAVFGDGSELPNAAFDVLGDYVYTDAETVIIHYRAGTDPSLWPAYFIDLVTVATAAKLAKPLAENSDRAAELNAEAFGPPSENQQGGLFAVAKTENAKSKRPASWFRNGDQLTSSRR